MKVGDRIRVLPSCMGPQQGRVGTITSIREGVATCKSPGEYTNQTHIDQYFKVALDFLEPYDWDDNEEI